MTVERDLLRAFQTRGTIPGRWHYEYTITQINRDPKYTACYSLRVDAYISLPGGESWILECKRILSMAGLGQLLTYDFLTGEKHRLGIVVGKEVERLKPVFKRYNIAVFQVDL